MQHGEHTSEAGAPKTRSSSDAVRQQSSEATRLASSQSESSTDFVKLQASKTKSGTASGSSAEHHYNQGVGESSSQHPAGSRETPTESSELQNRRNELQVYYERLGHSPEEATTFASYRMHEDLYGHQEQRDQQKRPFGYNGETLFFGDKVEYEDEISDLMNDYNQTLADPRVAGRAHMAEPLDPDSLYDCYSNTLTHSKDTCIVPEEGEVHPIRKVLNHPDFQFRQISFLKQESSCKS